MSQGLMVYLVAEQAIAAVIGCQDDDLLADILEQMANDFASLDEQFFTDDKEYGPGLTFEQALRELFWGSLSGPETCDFVYTYAFEEVCRYYGKWLGNSRFARCSTECLQHLDGLLTSGGVPLRFHDLLYRCPIQKTPYRERLGLGHWKRDEALRARSSLAQLVSAVRDEAERLALDEASEWLAAASEQPGSIIVGVFC
jgi:hypothetical protein